MPIASEVLRDEQKIMSNHTARTFLKQAALGTAGVLAYPSAKVLDANDRVRIGMIGVGDRGNDLLGRVKSISNVEVVAMADVYARMSYRNKKRITLEEAKSIQPEYS